MFSFQWSCRTIVLLDSQLILHPFQPTPQPRISLHSQSITLRLLYLNHVPSTMSYESPSSADSKFPRAPESQYSPSSINSPDVVKLGTRMRELNVSNDEPFQASSSTLQVLHSSGFTVEKYRAGSPPLNLLPLRRLTVNP